MPKKEAWLEDEEKRPFQYILTSDMFHYRLFTNDIMHPKGHSLIGILSNLTVTASLDKKSQIVGWLVTHGGK